MSDNQKTEMQKYEDFGYQIEPYRGKYRLLSPRRGRPRTEIELEEMTRSLRVHEGKKKVFDG